MGKMSLKTSPSVVITGFFITFFSLTVPVYARESEQTNTTETERYQLVVWDFHHVEVPYVICLWILLASVAKIGFHLYDRLSSILPESCLLIVMGIVVGSILHYTHTATTSQYVLDANTFFLFLLPPIIYDAGYHMPLRAFFNNLGTILLLAVVNTLWNTVAIGLSLWGASYIGWIARKISLLHCFMFSALISAVDPVAVLAVFEDVHVNEMLYIIVFGESLLNDGVTVVLYHMMEGYTEIGEANIQIVDFAAGIGSFFIIALGGTIIGVIYGFVGGFITKYTSHIQIIEPLFVFTLGYLAYLTAEMMHLSGILALTFGGITMRHYVEANMDQQSVTTTKYTLKMMANISETIMFMFLGLSTVVDTLDWQWDFIFFSILFCIVYRVIGVMCLSWVTNRRRVIRLSGIDQFIMSYGGLRGGIAFCLSLLIDDKLVPEKNMFITTTIIIVFFTVFVQLIDHVMAGMEDIAGKTSHNSLKNRFENFNIKVLKPLLLREKPQTRETTLLTVFSRLNVRDAMHHITSHGTFLGPLVVGDPASLKGSIKPHMSASSLPENDEVVLTPPKTIVDMHSVEAVYSKKDKDDTHLHHLLEDAMFRPRKTFVIEKKHTLDDSASCAHTLSHHQLHQQLRRLISAHLQSEQNQPSSEMPELSPTDTVTADNEARSTPTGYPAPEEKENESESEKVKISSESRRLHSVSSEHDSTLSDFEEALSTQSEETEVQRVLPWKRTTQLPPLSSSMSMSMPDDDHPLMCTVPSWANNLAYNHLTETGSPYNSPDNTIGAPPPAASYRPVFDIFPPALDTEASTPEKVESSHSPIPPPWSSYQKEVEPSHSPIPPPWSSYQKEVEPSHSPIPPPWSSHQTSLPTPWASSSSEDPPLTSPNAHKESCGEKVSTYLQSSSHNFFPPSHHSCLDMQEEAAAAQPSLTSARGLRPASSPQHFQPIQMEELCSRQVIETEIIADEADYQERLVTRVQSWLDSSEPSDCEEHDFEELSTSKADDHTVHFDIYDEDDLDDSHLDTYL